MIFAGTPQLAADCLAGLLGAGAPITAVLTRPDAPVGRKRKLTPSPVAQAAEAAELEVIKASRVDDDVVTALRAHQPRLGVVVAYGALLPEAALQVPEHGWVNLHYSKLPKYRGAAPVQHALLNGETTTAATVFQLERGMDTGPVHASVDYRIQELATAGDVLQDLTRVGTHLLVELLPALLEGTSEPVPQSGEPSYAPKLSRADAYIDPAQPAAAVVHRINATIPEPGAWTWCGPARLKLGPARVYSGAVDLPAGQVVLAASDRSPGEKLPVLATTDGGVVLTEVQPEGKKMMDATAWLRGLTHQAVLGG